MAKLTVGRRHFLLGGAVAGTAGAPIAALHDADLGPPQSFRGAVNWQEGAADSPPGGFAANSGDRS